MTADDLDPRFRRLIFPLYIPYRQGFFEVSPSPRRPEAIPLSIRLEEDSQREEMLRRVHEGTCDTAYFVDLGRRIMERSDWKSRGHRDALDRWADDGGPA